ncbi:MAG TPA: hypothetical protein VFZ97_10580 [Acidimicrobiales bacterium]
MSGVGEAHIGGTAAAAGSSVSARRRSTGGDACVIHELLRRIESASDGHNELMNTSVLISTFLATSIEVIEMVAIVVAVGATRQWRGALTGTLAGLVVLALLIAALGTALQQVPLSPIRVVVGALLLTFGSQWVRKGVLSVSRNGWTQGIGDKEVSDVVGDGFDWTGFLLAFRGVSLEGLEVAVIVVAFGAADHAIASAVIGAGASVLLVGALGAASYRLVARIPKRALQLFVGSLLTTFGTFWAGEGLGANWPGGDLALLWTGAFYVVSALVLVRQVSSWRRVASRGGDCARTDL